MSESNNQVIVIRTSYTEAQKRATYKWNQKNMDKVRASRIRHYYRQKETNQPLYELSHLLEAVSFREYSPSRPRGRPRKIVESLV
jgi:hypothetical protein